MLEEPEQSHGILEIGILGIEPFAIFLEVGDLSRQSSIENEGKRVDGGLGSRIEHIHLSSIPESLSQSVHTFIESGSLVGE